MGPNKFSQRYSNYLNYELFQKGYFTLKSFVDNGYVCTNLNHNSKNKKVDIKLIAPEYKIILRRIMNFKENQMYCRLGCPLDPVKGPMNTINIAAIPIEHRYLFMGKGIIGTNYMKYTDYIKIYLKEVHAKTRKTSND